MNTTHNNSIILLQMVLEDMTEKQDWKAVEMLNYIMSCIMLREHFTKAVAIVKDS